MKRTFITIIIISFAFMSMCFTIVDTEKSLNKAVSIKGTVIASQEGIKLKAGKNVYQLIGQTKGLNTKRGQIVLVKGFLINKRINVKTYVVINKPTVKPTAPPINAPKLRTLTGVLTESNIEGTHYELAVNKELYILIGKDIDFTKYTGKSVRVTGSELENQISIYQRGILFNVKTIEEATGVIKYGPLKEKYETLRGTVMIDTLQGAHIAFKVGEELYSLEGNVTGIEALNGKTIDITGYAPYIVYIRKPDFIIFNVESYRIVN